MDLAVSPLVTITGSSYQSLLNGTGLFRGRYGGAWGEIESPPIIAQRALFVPNLRGEAPEALTAGKDVHVS